MCPLGTFDIKINIDSAMINLWRDKFVTFEGLKCGNHSLLSEKPLSDNLDFVQREFLFTAVL